jgi:hypothetical protein
MILRRNPEEAPERPTQSCWLGAHSFHKRGGTLDSRSNPRTSKCHPDRINSCRTWVVCSPKTASRKNLNLLFPQIPALQSFLLGTRLYAAPRLARHKQAMTYLLYKTLEGCFHLHPLAHPFDVPLQIRAARHPLCRMLAGCLVDDPLSSSPSCSSCLIPRPSRLFHLHVCTILLPFMILKFSSHARYPPCFDWCLWAYD